MGWPTTAGTSTGCGPFDTLIQTVVFTVTLVPSGGSCASTSPAGLLEGTSRTFGFRCCRASASTAAVDCWPTTPGTSTFGRPVETQIVTSLPFGMRLPATGSCLKTSPDSVLVLAWWFTTG